MTFPSPDNTLNGKDGADIAPSDAQDRATYEAQGWLFRDTLIGYWWQVPGGLPYIDITPMAWGYFPGQDSTSNGKDGADILRSMAGMEQPYTAAGWDFDDVWSFVEGINRPTLQGIPEPPPPPGPPESWTEPRTDWEYGDAVAHIDMVRIEVNLRDVAELIDDHTDRTSGIHGVPAGEQIMTVQAVGQALEALTDQLTDYVGDRMAGIEPPSLTVEDVRQAANVPLTVETRASTAAGTLGRLWLRTDLAGNGGGHYEG